jgi:sugar-specific transcriptional regulator TrmB
MVDNKDSVQSFFQTLGLSPEESKLYPALVRLGTASTLQLARTTKLPRTSIYRYLEELKSLGLVEEIIDEHRKLAKAAEIDKLELLVASQKAKLNSLETLLPEIKSTLRQQSTSQLPDTRVIFFREKSGIEQLLWNTLNAQEIVGFTYLALDDVVGKTFAQKYREEAMIRKIKIREILSDDDPYLTPKTLKFMKSSPLFTYYEPRYLPAEKIKINHQVMIYNNVTSFYNWHEGEIFGIEIHNPTIFALQKQIFELLWKATATPEQTIKRRTSDHP